MTKVKLSDTFSMPNDYKSNGCGSGWSRYITPNSIYGVSIHQACRIHDHAYEIGRTIQDKQLADREFLNNILRLILAKEEWYYPTYLAKRRAYKYYKAVDNFGGVAFWKGKNIEE